MKIEVKIMDKEDCINSLPVPIQDFIVRPEEIEFEWEDGTTLPYKDFIFFGSEYYYSIFVNDEKIEVK